MTRLLHAAAFAAILGLLIARPAFAQLAGPDTAGRGTGDLLADQLVLLMQDALAGQGMPSEDQLTRAGVLLDLALGLSPSNAELWRTKAELAQVRGRMDERHKALAGYLRLVPTDDAAQLELVLGRVGQAQTVDDRLKLLERLLDAESSRALSAALRSRLASLAAKAAKELGDRGRYVQRLKQAMSLDSANGEAAGMLYELALQESDSPLHHGAAAIAWVRGAPANPAARLALARLLLRQGVYDEAAKQFGMAASLLPGPHEPELLRHWVLSIAAGGNVDEALDLIQQIESSPGPDGAPALLPFDLELLRLAMLSASQRRDEAQANWTRLVERLQPLIDAGDAAAQRELAVAGAVFGHDSAGAEARLPADTPEPIVQLVRGWSAIHAGDADRAREALRPIAESEHLAALGMAALERDEAVRLSMLDTIRRHDPDGIGGLLAAMETRRLSGKVMPTRDGQGLQDYLTRWPSRVWYTDLMWSPWLSMRLEIDPARLRYLEPIEGIASFRNLAGVPLAVGPNTTVPTRMIVSILPSKLGQAMPPLSPMVVDIGRTLTIPEGGSLRVPFRLDYSALGDLLAEAPGEMIDLQVTAVLDPRPTGTGAVRPGPVGAMDTNRASQSTPRPVTPESIESWLVALDGPDSLERFRAIARLLVALRGDGVDATTRERIGDTLGERFAEADPIEQAWALRFLPPDDRRPKGLRRVADLAQRSTEPLVRVTQLAAQVDSANDPALVAALREEDPVIGGFARALRTSLREGAGAQP